MKKIVIMAMACFLTIACANRQKEIEDFSHYSTVKNIMGETVKEYAQSGNVLIMDVRTGEVLFDYTVALRDDSLYVPTDNKESAFEPGALLSPMILSAVINDSKTPLSSGIMLPVGHKYFDGPWYVEDSKTIGDADSLPLHTAFARSSNVAICALAESSFENRHDTLISKVKEMFPRHRIEDLRIGEAKGISDIGNMVVDGPENVKNRKHRSEAKRFFEFCRGYGVKVYPKDILSFYRDMAVGVGRQPDMLRTFLIESAVYECGRQNIAGKAVVIVGSGKRGCITASFAGFFPVSDPQYAAIVSLYGTTATSRDISGLFAEIANEILNHE